MEFENCNEDDDRRIEESNHGGLIAASIAVLSGMLMLTLLQFDEGSVFFVLTWSTFLLGVVLVAGVCSPDGSAFATHAPYLAQFFAAATFLGIMSSISISEHRYVFEINSSGVPTLMRESFTSNPLKADAYVLSRAGGYRTDAVRINLGDTQVAFKLGVEYMISADNTLTSDLEQFLRSEDNTLSMRRRVFNRAMKFGSMDVFPYVKFQETVKLAVKDVESSVSHEGNAEVVMKAFSKAFKTHKPSWLTIEKTSVRWYKVKKLRVDL